MAHTDAPVNARISKNHTYRADLLQEPEKVQNHGHQHAQKDSIHMDVAKRLVAVSFSACTVDVPITLCIIRCVYAWRVKKQTAVLFSIANKLVMETYCVLTLQVHAMALSHSTRTMTAGRHRRRGCKDSDCSAGQNKGAAIAMTSCLRFCFSYLQVLTSIDADHLPNVRDQVQLAQRVGHHDQHRQARRRAGPLAGKHGHCLAGVPVRLYICALVKNT
jgi:hypothetical protein